MSPQVVRLPVVIEALESRWLPAAATLKAVAVVDGERLESQEFPAPSQGGIRLLLVATDKSTGASTEPNVPPIPGQVMAKNA